MGKHERLTTNEYLSKRRAMLAYAKHIDFAADKTGFDMIKLKNRVYHPFERAALRRAIRLFAAAHECMEAVIGAIETDMMNVQFTREARKAKRESNNDEQR